MGIKPRRDSYEVKVQPKLPLVIGWCRQGLSNQEVADNLGISLQSFYNYLKQQEDFADAVDKGKEDCAVHIENALVKRALGYKFREVTKERRLVELDNGESEYRLVTTKTTVKHVQPDVNAQIYYLEHRCPVRWERNPAADLDAVAINTSIKTIADLMNNPVPERKIGYEEDG